MVDDLPPEFEIRPLKPGDDCSGFRFGEASFQPLKTFITRRALDFQAIQLVRTYVAVDPETCVAHGFISLLCSQIKLAEESRPNEVSGADHYDDYPAIKIVRLGVNRIHQGRGLGNALMDYALSLTLEEVLPLVGCRFLVVDSKSSSTEFYERFGFRALGHASADGNGEHWPMYLDLLPLLEEAQAEQGPAQGVAASTPA